jgi:hypothetical protein
MGTLFSPVKIGPARIFLQLRHVGRQSHTDLQPNGGRQAEVMRADGGFLNGPQPEIDLHVQTRYTDPTLSRGTGNDVASVTGAYETAGNLASLAFSEAATLPKSSSAVQWPELPVNWGSL